MASVPARGPTRVSPLNFGFCVKSGAISLDILLALKGQDSYGAGFWSGLFGGFLPTTALLQRRTTKRLYFWAARP